jgi:hypothetical protein
MKYLILLLFSLVSLTAQPDSGPVQTCREQNAGNAEAHIACLEAALNEVLGAESRESAGNVAAEPVEPARDDGPTGLGAEQLRAVPTPEEAAIDAVQVRIVATRYSADGKGTFRMADGQVWRETMAAPERWRLEAEREYDARIKRGTLGGYRLHVDGISWMMTVRRIQ